MELCLHKDGCSFDLSQTSALVIVYCNNSYAKRDHCMFAAGNSPNTELLSIPLTLITFTYTCYKTKQVN